MPLDDPGPVLAGRGHLGVLEGSPRQGYDLEGYARTPWALIRTDVKELVAATIAGPAKQFGGEYRVSIECRDAVVRDFNAWSGTSGTNSYTFSNSTDTHTRMGYGTDGTAPSQADHDLIAQAGADIVDLDRSWDAAAESLLCSGSRIHSEAGVTAQEIAFLSHARDVGNNDRTILTDRALLDPAVDIATDQTVSMTYEFQM